jgi:AraC-like DNA-binding protein
MDALSRILSSVRLSTSLLSKAHFREPWAVHTAGARTAIFHTLVRGSCWLRPDDEPGALRLRTGDVVIVSRGDAHVMCSDPNRPPVAVASLEPESQTGGVPTFQHGGVGAETLVICGTFRLEHDAGASLLDQLPPFVHVASPDEATAAWVETTLQLMNRELSNGAPGAETVLSRLTDVLFVQVLRHLATTQPESLRGWWAAVRDDQIGRALAMMHDRPGDDWNASQLATRVGMSRSRFFERFSDLVGEPPAKYLAKCRVRAAAELLRRRSLSNAELAGLVGYSSEDGFTKMFKRHVGVSPREFRRQSEASS